MAKLADELIIRTKNEMGTLSKVTSPLKDAGVNIASLCAWGDADVAQFMLIVDDAAPAFAALQGAGFSVVQEQVVVHELDNSIGTLDDVAGKIQAAGINIEYCYVTTTGPKCMAVFSTENNPKTVVTLGA